MTNNRAPHPQRKLAEKALSAKTKAEQEKVQSAKSALRVTGQETLIRRHEVQALTGISRSTLYDWMKRGEFPQPVRLGARLVAWRESDVTAWLESRETRVA